MVENEDDVFWVDLGELFSVFEVELFLLYRCSPLHEL